MKIHLPDKIPEGFSAEDVAAFKAYLAKYGQKNATKDAFIEGSMDTALTAALGAGAGALVPIQDQGASASDYVVPGAAVSAVATPLAYALFGQRNPKALAVNALMGGLAGGAGGYGYWLTGKPEDRYNDPLSAQ
jgi:hypothetical protein